jgi:hypothetical protein
MARSGQGECASLYLLFKERKGTFDINIALSFCIRKNNLMLCEMQCHIFTFMANAKRENCSFAELARTNLNKQLLFFRR